MDSMAIKPGAKTPTKHNKSPRLALVITYIVNPYI